MEVSWHADARVVVLSLWQDGTCRSTFRMAVRDAPDLVCVLSSALGDALAPGSPAVMDVETPHQGNVARLIPAMLRTVRGRRAEVLPFRDPRSGPAEPGK